MQDRERILSFLQGTLPDRVPWFGDLSYWATAMEARGEVPRGWQSSPDYYRFHRELGVGFYLQGYFAFTARPDASVVIEERVEGLVRRRHIHTPVGDLEEEWRYLPASWASAPVRHLVNTPADLAPLRYWWEHTHYAPSPALAAQRRQLIGGDGLVLCYLPRSPFMEMVAELAGITNMVTIWAQEPEEFAATLSVMAERADLAAEAALTAPADCFMIPENLSSEMVGKRFYREFVQPWERKWVERIRAAGKVSFIHMDGTLRGLLREVSETGFDVIEAVTPAPTGDLNLVEARALAGPHPILWGGLPGALFTPLVSDAEFEQQVREALEVMVADRHMVLGVADQVPPDGTRARIGRVVELAECYGRYR